MSRIIFSIVCVFLLLGVGYVTPVYSQSASEAAVLNEPAKISTAEREKQLLDLYQAQVERYREMERKYKISKAQYFKLNTLQSLEEVVVDARTAMELRGQVLITYLELLHEILDHTPGIELSQKTATLTGLEEQVVALRTHIQTVQSTTDRPGIAARANEFEPIGAKVKKVSLSAQGLVVIGRLQAVYDASESTYGDILTYHGDNKVSALKQSERERAYKEVVATFTQVDTQLQKAKNTFEEESKRGTPDTREVVNQLNSVYTSTSQLLDFLKELVLKLT